jgi:hypothetical protein
MHFTPVVGPSQPRASRHIVPIRLALAAGATYAATGLAVVSLWIAWSERGKHFSFLMPPFQTEGSNAIHPGGWISVPSDSGPQMAVAIVFAVLACVAAWVVGWLCRREYRLQKPHSTRRGLLWGIPLALVVAPLMLVPVMWGTHLMFLD